MVILVKLYLNYLNLLPCISVKFFSKKNLIKKSLLNKLMGFLLYLNIIKIFNT